MDDDEILSDEQEEELLAQMQAEEPEMDGEEEKQQANEEAPAEEQREESAQADEEQREEEKDDRDKTVPIHALHEARQQNKELRDELGQTRDKITRMEALFERFQNEQKAAQDDSVPDIQEDPIGYMQQGFHKLNESVSNLQQQSNQQQQFAQTQQHVQQLERQFAEKTPDYGQALQRVKQAQFAELKAMGLNDQQAAQELANREWQFVQTNLQYGRNPAEAIYNLAKDAYGYAPAQSVSEMNNQMREQMAEMKAEDKIDQIERGKKAAGNNGGGESSADNMTLERLASLDGEDFDKAWAKMVGGNVYS